MSLTHTPVTLTMICRSSSSTTFTCCFQRFDPLHRFTHISIPISLTKPSSFSTPFLTLFKPSSSSSSLTLTTQPPQARRKFALPATMLHQNPLVSDICALAVSGAIAFSFLRFFEETAKRSLFDQKLNRKLVHVSIGLIFMLCWPLYSSDGWGPILASLIPGINIIRMLVIGLGIYKDEATVKSMSRFGDYRELLKGPLYYAATITLASIIYWRTSPISIAAICNLCAGDGLADIVGRRFGDKKIPYNRNKSYAGSIAMAAAGFLTSVGYMSYFSWFGYMEGSLKLVLGFLVVSVVTALVESLPISTELDDNLTVPLTSILVGTVIF
ncbi:hypothetical protein Ahy_A01g004367 isoform A [Arachis hypogaea]|nr:probable phytol kinase 3, chloroplastic [Arachis hypogaea]RYR79564.1 hypothetical protein Ahy_A01g004367 isoform A [Arachis hypogaea]